MASNMFSGKLEAFPLTDKDRQILSMTDEQYKPHTWENLKMLISNNDLHLLTRYPSQLRLYLEWSADTKDEWGSVTNFVMKNRLFWEPAPPEECQSGSLFKAANTIPLSAPDDFKILVNDWPYGLDLGIKHIIVWLKHRLPATPDKGDLTPDGREMLENFVDSKFRSKLGRENVLWFRNWTGLQSVRALEHFHVLVRSSDAVLDDILQ